MANLIYSGQVNFAHAKKLSSNRPIVGCHVENLIQEMSISVRDMDFPMKICVEGKLDDTKRRLNEGEALPFIILVR